MNMALKRGSQEYRVENATDVANDRYIGMIDGKVIAEGDTPEDVLASLIRAPTSKSGSGGVGEEIGIDPFGEVGHGGRADRQ